MTSPPGERIIGYDAREFSQNLDTWSEQAREGYLYRLDVVKPLSVDAMIWPSIFSADHRPPPLPHVGFQSFWSEFARLRTAVTTAFEEKPLSEYRMIAATLVLDPDANSQAVPWDERIPPVDPDRREPDWKFLGFDVADQWALSGLTDCGFVPGLDDVRALRQRWAPLLNKFHLFDRYSDARDFRRFSDERMKDDHAPFFVFGLWLLR